VVVWQHPLYWYSVPPLLKQWMDLVLEHGWAYGSRGTALQGKSLLSAVSAGGPAHAYAATGHNRYTIPELLRPLERTALLCGMDFLPPWVVFGTHRLSEEDIRRRAEDYEGLLRWLVSDGHRDLPVPRPELLDQRAAVPHPTASREDGP
jgi:glutathione-regulated potassium-efflux system ancillary protein KefG